ncbi:uncharacterized protein LOC131010380 [Salvia miltiorrhiza]|uniref:uncharacterized protein LOC131010380 n=1 Tax=Salvia miltiorrhiza TaxID=226208 RepID=UPI0025ABD9E2|nr:uncharacterized protein LOC131010380 [Salvia miltiorrhiza]
MPTAAVNIAAASTPPPKRLLFDRRYGWILDEWKEPSEEALSGGRGMFCVVPLAKALIQKASETVNFVGSSTLGVLERPELLSPKAVQATLTHQMHRFVSSVNNARLVPTAPGRSNETASTPVPMDLPEGNTEGNLG